MTKKTVHIISHSHWDREWYMAYEQHHMRLVRLMDDLLDLFKRDPEFHSFHLDGQTIILDDYLQVRPEREAEVRKAIADGKLRIGPFYILQDDFLISSESNVRNMLVGKEECKKWGASVPLGYFPDTFGNMGQTPQLMKKAGLDAAAFGRGIRPTGFNNQVDNSEKFTSQFSEMNWQGPDNSEILGILFANWYSNGNEIPTTEKEARLFWGQKLADVERFASTNHLLMMNGVDHQPVQLDVTKAIRLANELYPDYHFIHSCFEDYIAETKAELPADLSTVQGEITSQETDGWYTLANTSSARIYLKQANVVASRQLENVAEPLATMAYEVTETYPHDELRYAWKTLMQNHPHDSICGCSVDAVHREMLPRFAKATEVGRYVADRTSQQIAEAIDSTSFPEDSRPFVLFNTTGHARQEVTTVTLEWQRFKFGQRLPKEVFSEAQAVLESLPDTFQVIDSQGNRLEQVELLDKKVAFDYELPERTFRVAYFAIQITVQIPAHLEAMSWQTYALQAAPKAPENSAALLFTPENNCLENSYLSVQIKSNGLLDITDKVSGQVYKDQLQFEDCGDIGNEYIFRQPDGDQAHFAHDGQVSQKVLINTPLLAEIELTQMFAIPVAADALLQVEMESVVDITERKAQRSQEMTELTLTTRVRMEKDNPQLRFTTSFENTAKNHRLRVLFPSPLQVDTHFADSIFETVERPNRPNAQFWKNPSNPQHQQAFVSLFDGKNGMTIGNLGLHEYEILPETPTIAVTLLRSVGELGDWGYFPTPEAQCIGHSEVSFTFESVTAESRFASYLRTQQVQVPWTVQQTGIHSGSLPCQKSYISETDSRVALTAFKRRLSDQAIITRCYNLSSDEAAPLTLHVTNHIAQVTNLLEETSSEMLADKLQKAEILTLSWTE